VKLIGVELRYVENGRRREIAMLPIEQVLPDATWVADRQLEITVHTSVGDLATLYLMLPRPEPDGSREEQLTQFFDRHHKGAR